MQVGYNTNVSYKGTVYHVQTEDNGMNNPVVVTLLYVKGTILSAKRTNYADIVNDPDSVSRIRELMKEQHKAMIKELIAGKHTAPAELPQEAEPPPQPKPAPQEPPVAAANAAPPPAAAVNEPAPAETDKCEEKKQISRSLDDILLDYIMKDEGNTPE